MDTNNGPLTHIDSAGNPGMVEVSHKQITVRTATAQSIVEVGEEISALLEDEEIKTKKGPVFQTAIIAGTIAVKKTSELIPLCHPLLIEGCSFDIRFINSVEIKITCTVTISGKTGVEMEALTGASIAALTIYDMCKAVSHNIIIRETKLQEKSGGKNDFTRK